MRLATLGAGVEGRVLTSFLNEMDGADVSSGDGVLVMAATNRPWVLDKALMRSGRFEKRIYVGQPDFEGRVEIFKVRGREERSDELGISQFKGVIMRSDVALV